MLAPKGRRLPGELRWHRAVDAYQSGGVVVLGVLLGVGAAGASTHLLRALLFGVAWNDPPSYAAVAAALFGVAMLACWLPAKRAARLDPRDSLRG